MTHADHDPVMKRVGIADLKAHLSEHLRSVRAGRTIIVLDRELPIARIVPHEGEEALAIRKATRRLGDWKLPPPPRKSTDSLAVLLEDRASR